jgi:hypothetical protein
MQIGLLDLLVANLRQDIPRDMPGYLSREMAYIELKRKSGQDFGDDIAAWEKWCEEENQEFQAEIDRFMDEHNITT